MIQLDIHEYCHDCPSFEAHVHKPQGYYSDNIFIPTTDTIISCEHKTYCKHVQKYYEQKSNI